MGAPQMLVEAFRAIEDIAAIAVITAEEGFDVDSMRVLTAWQQTVNVWESPKRTCPDDARPTPAAWRWILAGWHVDVETVAIAADVSRATAQAKLDVLMENRLIYPDGSTAKAALAALQAHVRERLGLNKPPSKTAPKATGGN